MRESLTLPLLFISVAVGGGFRAAAASGDFQFVVAPLIHLVLGLLVVAVLVRAGVLAPERVMNAARTPLENFNGAVVLVTLFAATAQVLNALTPESGLLHFAFVLVFGLLFWNTLAMAPDARQGLRSLVLAFGAALVLKHVVLSALFEPQPSLTKRVLTALLEGVTLGGLQFEPSATLTGYVAFATVLLYFVGLFLLPRATIPCASARPALPHTLADPARSLSPSPGSER